MIRPHTCSEWNSDSDTVCGKPAPFHLKIVNTEDKTTITNWKCHVHIRRYHRIDRSGKIRVTITAYKGSQDAAKPSASRKAPRKRQRARR